MRVGGYLSIIPGSIAAVLVLILANAIQPMTSADTSLVQGPITPAALAYLPLLVGQQPLLTLSM